MKENCPYTQLLAMRLVIPALNYKMCKTLIDYSIFNYPKTLAQMKSDRESKSTVVNGRSTLPQVPSEDFKFAPTPLSNTSLHQLMISCHFPPLLQLIERYQESIP
jgi:hypothetical protein